MTWIELNWIELNWIKLTSRTEECLDCVLSGSPTILTTLRILQILSFSYQYFLEIIIILWNNSVAHPSIRFPPLLVGGHWLLSPLIRPYIQLFVKYIQYCMYMYIPGVYCIYVRKGARWPVARASSRIRYRIAPLLHSLHWLIPSFIDSFLHWFLHWNHWRTSW